MTRLTWQNVTAPDFSGAAHTQQIAARAFDSAIGRVSDGLTAFDNNRKDVADSVVMQNMLKYQDADALQQALASGQLTQGANPEHVRAETLLKAQGQVGDLMRLAASRQDLRTGEQTFNHNELVNPFKVRKAEADVGYILANTQGTEAQTASVQQSTEQGKTTFNQTQENLKLNEAAEKIWSTDFVNIGSPQEAMQRIDEIRAENPKLGQALFNRYATLVDPGVNSLPFNRTATQFSGLPAVDSSDLGAGSAGIAGIGSANTTGAATAATAATGVGGVGGKPTELSNLKLPDVVQKVITEVSKRTGLPDELMQSIIVQEISGKGEYFDNPAKYHYEPGTDGKRKSTAFGPYGILDSTAKDPGHGVAPLKDKNNLEEQTRFATEYLAGRIKDAVAKGGTMKDGIAGYGQGVKYAEDVMKRLKAGTVAAEAVPTKTEQRVTAAAAAMTNQVAAGSLNQTTATAYQNAFQKGIDNPKSSKADVLAEITAASGKDGGGGGVLANMDRKETARYLDYVAKELGSNYWVAAEVLKNASFSGSSWNFSLGQPWRTENYDENSIKEEVAKIKENGGIAQFTALSAKDNLNNDRTASANAAKKIEDLTAKVANQKALVNQGVRGADVIYNNLLNELNAAKQSGVQVNKEAIIAAQSMIPVNPTTTKKDKETPAAKVIESKVGAKGAEAPPAFDVKEMTQFTKDLNAANYQLGMLRSNPKATPSQIKAKEEEVAARREDLKFYENRVKQQKADAAKEAAAQAELLANQKAAEKSRKNAEKAAKKAAEAEEQRKDDEILAEKLRKKYEAINMSKNK